MTNVKTCQHGNVVVQLSHTVSATQHRPAMSMIAIPLTAEQWREIVALLAFSIDDWEEPEARQATLALIQTIEQRLRPAAAQRHARLAARLRLPVKLRTANAIEC